MKKENLYNMSIDFGNDIFAKAKEESLAALKNIKNICYNLHSGGDGNYGPSEVYSRKTVCLETDDLFINYVIDNSVFSGFVDSARIVVTDKNTKIRKMYKLEKQSNTEEIEALAIHSIGSRVKLLREDYEFIDDFDSDCFYFGGPCTKRMPLIGILHNEDDFVIVDSVINNRDSYITFRVKRNELINVIYCDKACSDVQIMSLSEVREEEYLDALKKANEALFGDLKNNKFVFDNIISFEYDSKKEENTDLEDEILLEDRRLEEICKQAMVPCIPKLNVFEFDNHTLTLPKDFSHLSGYLVRFILHSLRITPDSDINEFYYRCEKSDESEINLVVPGNYEVIDDYACMSKHFSTVTIEEGVKVIGEDAFRDSNANVIKLPQTITNINKGAFCNNAIEEITIPRKVENLSGDLFANCDNLKKIIVDSNNKIYKTNDANDVVIERANDRLTIALNNSIIPEGIKIIGKKCFSWLKGENELIIPEGVVKIEDGAFSTCNFNKIIFPDSLTEIGNSAFWQCGNLTKLVFPKNLKTIGDNSFTYCHCLRDVYFNSDVTIGKYCFGEKTNIHNFARPEISSPLLPANCEDAL